jgi:hypothetical protein
LVRKGLSDGDMWTNHEVDRRPTAENVGGRHDGSTAAQPLGWAGLIERSRLGVQLHVPGEDTRAVDPWVVEIALARLDEQDLEVVVEIGQAAGHDTAA